MLWKLKRVFDVGLTSKRQVNKMFLEKFQSKVGFNSIDFEALENQAIN